MHALKACFWLLCAILLLTACSRGPAPITLSGSTMGTYWTVRLASMPARVDAPGLRREIEALLDEVNAEMSTYRPDSVITAFNNARAGDVIDLPPGFAGVLGEALYWAEATGGAFDPTIGPVVDLWGFGPDGAIDVYPDPDELMRRLALVGWERLEFDPESARVQQPGGLRLDLSGIAKGWGVDVIAEHLQARGIDGFLIDIGGDLRVQGQRPDGQDWRVAIERPQPGRGEARSLIESSRAAIATSGDYRNFVEFNGQRYSHLIDPASGRPIDHATVSVTAVAETCTTADALATALHVMPPDRALEFAIERDLAVLWLLVEDGELVEQSTPRFERLIETGEL